MQSIRKPQHNKKHLLNMLNLYVLDSFRVNWRVMVYIIVFKSMTLETEINNITWIF